MNQSNFEKTVNVLADRAGFVRFDADEDPDTPIDWSSDYSRELVEFARLVLNETIGLIDNEIEFQQGLETINAHDADLVKKKIELFEKFKATFQEHFGMPDTAGKAPNRKIQTSYSQTWNVW